MKTILIVYDNHLDNEYTWWARHEGEILKREFNVVYSRPFTTSQWQAPPNIDLVLWITEPSHYQYIRGPKNIGWDLMETNHPMGSLLDEFVGPSKLVPFVDYSLFIKPVKPAIRQLEGEYIIYTVNDKFDKSSSLELIKAFHLTFDPCEPVSLVLKTDRQIDHDINYLKKSLNLYPSIENYKKEIVITGPIQYSELWSMANYFDCFVETDPFSKRFREIGRHHMSEIGNMRSAYKLNNMSSYKTDWSNYIDHINFFKERC